MAVKVFISYKHQDAKRNQWVEKLYRDLRASGIDAKLDKFEVAPGQSFSNYMTKGIRDCNYVLFIVTPNAVKAVESGHGALAFEMQISNARRLAKRKKFSIIPIFREGNKTSTYLMDHRYLDFRIDANYEINLQQLIKWLNGEIQPPPLGGNTAAPRDDLVIQKQKLLEPISALAETLQSSNIQELSYIYALLEQIREIESKSFISIADFLNPICRSIEATCVFTLRIFPNGDLQIERSSDYLSSEVSGESFYSSMLKEIKQLLDKNRSLDTGLVFFDMREKSDLANNSIFLMELDTKFHFLVITAKQWNITPNANILGQTLFSLYKATDKFKFLDVLEAEERILDDIKLIYGHIPQEIYERRYDLYKYQLRFTTCYFQPVVYVADNEVAVDSWEALPWNAEKKELVSDLLIAADLWGERFSLEFDLYFLRESILRYIEVFFVK